MATPPGPLVVRLAAGWMTTIAMIALAGFVTLLPLAAGMGIAWSGNRLLPRP